MVIVIRLRFLESFGGAEIAAQKLFADSRTVANAKSFQKLPCEKIHGFLLPEGFCACVAMAQTDCHDTAGQCAAKSTRSTYARAKR